MGMANGEHVRLPRVQVSMGRDFYAALTRFATEQECSPASLILRATKAYLSQHKRWASSSVSARAERPLGGNGGVGSTGSAGTETVDTETGGDRRSDTHLESARVGRGSLGQEGCSK